MALIDAMIDLLSEADHLCIYDPVLMESTVADGDDDDDGDYDCAPAA